MLGARRIRGRAGSGRDVQAGLEERSRGPVDMCALRGSGEYRSGQVFGKKEA